MVIYPINGKNTRLGKLFKTPKHLLLYKGFPALQDSVQYMRQFGSVTILCRPEYRAGIEALTDSPYFKPNIFEATETDNVIDTIKQIKLKDKIWIVDCDVVPINLNPPKGNTVYLFKNEKKMPDYSNFSVKNHIVIECNEKGEPYQYAGAGIYYFEMNDDFYNYSIGCQSVSQVLNKMILAGKKVHADTTSEIFRFGTLNDITA